MLLVNLIFMLVKLITEKLILNIGPVMKADSVNGLEIEGQL